MKKTILELIKRHEGCAFDLHTAYEFKVLSPKGEKYPGHNRFSSKRTARLCAIVTYRGKVKIIDNGNFRLV